MAKTFFAPLPPRAVGDQRLRGLHFRVLAAIALHDRMSRSRKAGQGCWAGNKKLAEECGCNYNNLSTVVTELVRFGYVVRDPHPINRRLRVYRVVYDEADTDFVKPSDSSSADEASQPVPVTEVCPQANNEPEIVRPVFEDAEEAQELRGVEYIPLKREDIPLKGEKNSPEGAPTEVGAGFAEEQGDSVGAQLAKFEREFNAGQIETDDLMGHWATFLTKVHFDGSLDDPNTHRAGRLIDNVEHELHRRGAL